MSNKLFCISHDISQNLSLEIEEVKSENDYCHGFIVEDDDEGYIESVAQKLNQLRDMWQEVSTIVETYAEKKYNLDHPDAPLQRVVIYVTSCA